MAKVIELADENIFQCGNCKKMIKFTGKEVRNAYTHRTISLEGPKYLRYVDCPNCNHLIRI